MAKKKKRRKKREYKIRSTHLAPVISPEEQRKKFPKELLKVFLDLGRTSIKVKESGVQYDMWTDKAYDLYMTEAKKYLGEKINDRTECGKLIVLLSKATMDLRYGKTKKEKKEKQVKKDS